MSLTEYFFGFGISIFVFCAIDWLEDLYCRYKLKKKEDRKLNEEKEVKQKQLACELSEHIYI